MAKEKSFKFLFYFLFFTVFSIKEASAVCPVCTVAVAGGLGISRWLGIDDFISGLWIGGLALSITIWCWNYLKKKNKLSMFTGFLALLAVYAMTIYPLYLYNLVGIAGNTIWGIDKVISGVFSGTIIFWLGVFFHSVLKKKNKGKVYFPFQKVAVPFSFLLLASIAYYALCKCV